MKLKMDRFTWLQKVCVPSFFLLFSLYTILNKNHSIDSITIGGCVVIALILYFIIEFNPLSKIVFDSEGGNVIYYSFMLFRRSVAFNSIIDIAGQTKSERVYGKGRSKTIYITDVFLFTEDNEYQVKVFERAKINEFVLKYNIVKKQRKI